jgi:hypothetical protein
MGHDVNNIGSILNLLGRCFMVRGLFVGAILCLTLGDFSGKVWAQQMPASASSDNPSPTTIQSDLSGGVYDLTMVYAREGAAQAYDQIAYSDLNMTVIRLQKEFEHSPAYQAALAELTQAHDALDAARRPVLLLVAEDPRYQDLAKKHENVSQVLAEGGLGTIDMLDLARRKMEYGSEMTLIAAKAMDNDQPVLAARQRLVTAQKMVDHLREQFELNLYKNPDWIAAKQTYNNAEVGLAGAQLAVVGANVTACLAAEADARHSLYNYAYGNWTYGNPYYVVGRTY